MSARTAAAAAQLDYHPFANLFPLIKGQAFDELVADIRANGQIEPIILYGGRILDGRNRYRACLAAGVDPHFRTFEGSEQEARDLVLALNLHRRHLTTSQRAMVASRLQLHAGVHNRIAAQDLKISRFLLRQANKVRHKGAPHIVAMVEAGTVPVAAAEFVVDTHSPQQQGAMRTPEKVLEAAAAVRHGRNPFLKYSEHRLLVTVGDLTSEIAGRGLGAMRAGAGDVAEHLKVLDGAIATLTHLRDALAGKGGAA